MDKKSHALPTDMNPAEPGFLESMAIYDVAQYLSAPPNTLRPFSYVGYPSSGIVSIPIRGMWGKDRITLPPFIPHNHHIGDTLEPDTRPFPKAFREKSAALIFWLDPLFIAPDGKMPARISPELREDMNLRLQAFCDGLAHQLNIPAPADGSHKPVEYRLFIPDTHLREKLPARAGCAVIVGVAPEHLSKLRDNTANSSFGGESIERVLTKCRNTYRPNLGKETPDMHRLDFRSSWRDQFIPKNPQDLSTRYMLSNIYGLPALFNFHERSQVNIETPKAPDLPGSTAEIIPVGIQYDATKKTPKYALAVWLKPTHRPSKLHDMKAAQDLEKLDIQPFASALSTAAGKTFTYQLVYPTNPRNPSALVLFSPERETLACLSDTIESWTRQYRAENRDPFSK